ncbi:MAG: VCBS repeat-containing protein [Salinivirgaceae bacterium]|nr:VCBS repeat-containing protein [Salinivirgaceae bacterium]
MKKYIILLILCVINSHIWAQNILEVKSIELGSEELLYDEYIARDFITLKGGFTFSASEGISFKGSIDESLIFDVVPELPFSETDLNNLDYSLPVGTTNGGFKVSESGGATYQIPIHIPPGTQGIQPNLSITYNSQSGNGLLGAGWNLAGVSAIVRVAQTLEQDGSVHRVNLSGDDRFALDGNRLQLTSSGIYGQDGSKYRTEVESFKEITLDDSDTNNAGPDEFIVKTDDGKIIKYGSGTSTMRINTKNIVWKISRVTDRFGNYMTYTYQDIDGEHLLKEINYTGNTHAPYNKIVFHYGSKDSDRISYIGGERITQKHLLREIKVFSEGDVIRSYEMNYAKDFVYKLNEVIETGSDGKKFNPTKFVYNSENQYVSNEIAEEGYSNINTITGDYNGDGLTDLLEFAYDIPVGNYTLIHYFHWNLRLNNGDGTYTFVNYEEPIPENLMHEDVMENVGYGNIGYSGLRNIDFNGDGKDDMIISTPDGSTVRHKIYTFDGTKLTFLTEFADVGEKEEEWPNKLYLGDFDADGRTDVVTRSLDIVDDGKGYLTFRNNGDFDNPLQVNFGFEYDFNGSYTFDINGDGLPEICNIEYDNNSYYYSFKDGLVLEEEEEDEVPYSKIIYGDFNGDGTADKMFYYSNLATNTNTWGLRLNKGDNTYADIIDISGLHDPDFNTWENKTHFVMDINGDGKSDVLELIDGDFFVNYSTGLGFIQEQVTLPINPFEDELDYGDFDGDGTMDVFIGNGSNSPYVVSLNKYSSSNKVKVFCNGLGNKTEVAYSTLADSDVYTKYSGATYPIQDLGRALTVVSTVSIPNGVGATKTKDYNYEGGKIHLRGKGFLGFSLIQAEDSIANSKIVSMQNWEGNTYFVDEIISELRQLSTDKLYSSVSVDFDKRDLESTTGKKRYIIEKSSKIVTNGYNNDATTINYYYDHTYNRLSSKIVSYSGGASETQTTEYGYADYSTSDYNLIKKYSISKISEIDGSTHTETTLFDGITGENQWIYRTVNGLSTFMQYDEWGNLVHSEFTVDGVKRELDHTYDEYGRFVIEKKTNAYISDKFTEVFSFDKSTGQILSQAAINGLTTVFGYDGFGRLLNTITPEGNETTSELLWNNSAKNNFVYSQVNIVPGKGSSTIYFDELGRDVKTIAESFEGQLLTSTKTYLANGKLQSGTLPHLDDENKDLIYTYYGDGRMHTKSVRGNTITYDYFDSERATTVTNADGSWSKKTIDGAGKLRKAEDDGGIISYTYHGCGKMSTMDYEKGKTIRMTYDKYGFQESLNDPDVGNVVTYDYNELGELKQLLDANGKTTDYEYDAYGRTTIEDIQDEGKIEYYYAPSGSGIGQVNYISYNDNMKWITHDELGRVETMGETINGKTLVRHLEYNNYNELVKELYDVDMDHNHELVLENEYDHGILKKVTMDDQNIWQLNRFNSDGQIENYDIGNENVLRKYDSKGYLERINFSDYHYSYTFNHSNGNLEQRTNSYSGIRESFEYDGLDRLTVIKHDDVVVQSINYDNTGNITDKTNAGYYGYSKERPGAIKQVNTLPIFGMGGEIPTDISPDPQDITYTSFHSPATISQGDHLYKLKYGSSKQRKKMDYYHSGRMKTSTYYYTNFEREIDHETGTDKQTFYIKGLGGLAAIFQIENGEKKLYHAHTDHQGSLIALRDASTGLIAGDTRYSYDAWGRRRNPVDYSFSRFNTAVTNRGYTMHEHLSNVQLINMNGRVYDPILGKMLSPDNFIQSPTSTQSLNRYSYCLNNPLKYTDPSGEKLFSFLYGVMAAIMYVPILILKIPESIVLKENPFHRANAFFNAMVDRGHEIDESIFGGGGTVYSTTGQPGSEEMETYTHGDQTYSGYKFDTLEEMLAYMERITEDKDIEVSGYILVDGDGVTYWVNDWSGNTDEKSVNPTNVRDPNGTMIERRKKYLGDKEIVLQIHTHPEAYYDRIGKKPGSGYYDGPSLADFQWSRKHGVPVISIGPNSVSYIDSRYSEYQTLDQFKSLYKSFSSNPNLLIPDNNPFAINNPNSNWWINILNLLDLN